MTMRELPDVWIRYRETKCPAAHAELVNEYLPLTRYVASQMSKRLPPSVEFDDLVSYGSMGLLDAIEKFDTDKGVKFGTYAVNRIRGAVLDELRSLDWVPRSVRTKHRAVERAVDSLEATLGRTPTDQEMADELGLPVSELAGALSDASATSLVGLEDLGQGRTQSILDTLVDTTSDDPLASRIGSEVAETMAAVVADLDVRQRTVLALYCVEELTLSEIGELLGVTESRVCQMHTRTVASLQDLLESRGAGVVAF